MKPIEACHQAVGFRIRLVREALCMTQDDLAQRVGMKRTSVTNIEIGRQRLLLDSVEDFARALGTTPKHLLKGIWWCILMFVVLTASAHAECLQSVPAVRAAHGRAVHVTWEHGCYFAGYPRHRKEVAPSAFQSTHEALGAQQHDSRPGPAYSLAGADNQGRRLIDQLKPQLLLTDDELREIGIQILALYMKER